MVTDFCLGIAGQAAIRKQHVVVELLGIAQFLDAWYFFADHRVAARCAVEIQFRKAAVVPVGMLGLNNDCAYPRGGLAGVQFRRADEFCVTPAIRPFCESLNGDTEQALAQEHDQHLKLIVAQIFISKLHSPHPPLCRPHRLMQQP